MWSVKAKVVQLLTSSHSYMNEYLVIDSGGYLYKQSLRINCSMATREVKMVSD